MNHNGNIIDTLQNILNDYERLFPSVDCVNTYIEKHESALVLFGLFPRGLRVRYDPQGRVPNHNTLDGVFAILSMNMEIIEKKFNLYV